MNGMMSWLKARVAEVQLAAVDWASVSVGRLALAQVESVAKRRACAVGFVNARLWAHVVLFGRACTLWCRRSWLYARVGTDAGRVWWKRRTFSRLLNVVAYLQVPVDGTRHGFGVVVNQR